MKYFKYFFLCYLIIGTLNAQNINEPKTENIYEDVFQLSENITKATEYHLTADYFEYAGLGFSFLSGVYLGVFNGEKYHNDSYEYTAYAFGVCAGVSFITSYVLHKIGNYKLAKCIQFGKITTDIRSTKHEVNYYRLGDPYRSIQRTAIMLDSNDPEYRKNKAYGNHED